MAHGGPRKGAGRQPKAVAKQAKLAAEIKDYIGHGPGTPSMLDIMEGCARYFLAQATDAEAILATIAKDRASEAEPEQQFDIVLAEVKKAAGLRVLAAETAAKAAKYRHAAIAPVQPASGTDTQDFVPLPERLKAYTKRDLIEQSAGKIVEMKRKP